MYHYVLLRGLLDLLVHPVLLDRQHVNIGFRLGDFSILSEPIYEAILAAQAVCVAPAKEIIKKVIEMEKLENYDFLENISNYVIILFIMFAQSLGFRKSSNCRNPFIIYCVPTF
jgi:hypothetical protein